MPQKSKGREKPSTSAIPAAPGQRVQANATDTAPSAMLATPVHPPPNLGPHSFAASRPTLPPLSQLHTQSASNIAASPYPTSGASYVPASQHVSLGALPPQGPPHALPRISTDPRGYSAIPARPPGSEYHQANPSSETEFSPTSIGRSHNPLKRGADYSETTAERPQPYGGPQYAHHTLDPNDPRPFRVSPSVSTTSTPTTASYPVFGQPSFSSRHSATSSVPMSSRCSLHVRQQPRAARAGPDGKDRRPIDPPPVLQLLMTDFDPSNPTDVEELQNSYYVVHCRLISATSPGRDVSTLAATTEDGSKEIQRLLLGTAVASPHHTKDDPDPPTMPEHPISEGPSGPPSPSSRFIPISTHSQTQSQQHTPQPPPHSARHSPHSNPQNPPTLIPSTFFIFADISVRKAGEYRLEFNLMKVEAMHLVPGTSMPILHTIATDVFKVVNAKDFDQVQPSTKLVRGLIDRGAGFPLKLKKGTREGQRRRTGGGGGSDGDGSDDVEEEDNRRERGEERRGSRDADEMDEDD